MSKQVDDLAGDDGRDPPAADSVKDGGFILASRIVAQVSQFLIFLVGVRFLSQAEFGLFALASATSSLILFIARAGWGQYILAGRVEPQHVGYIYGIATVWGIVLTIAGVLIGLAAAGAMSTPTLGYVIALISLSIAPFCYSKVNESTMIRRGKVRAVAIIFIVAELAGLAAGIVTLSMGWKEYGLVAARLTVCVIATLGSMLFNQARPTLKGPRDVFDSSAKYYRDILGTVLLSYAGNNSGLYIVGLWFGGAAAGVYRGASRFSSAVMEFIWEPTGVLAWKNIPPTDAENARGLDKRVVVGQRYQAFMRVFALIVCPMMLGVAAVAPELTTLLLGENWKEVGPLFMFLVSANMFMLPFMIAGTVFSALDASRKIVKLQTIHLVAFLAILFGVGWYSPLVAAAVHVPPALLLMWLAVREVSRLLEISQSEVLQNLTAPFLCALVMAGVVTAARIALIGTGSNVFVVLLGAIASGIVAYSLLVVILCRPLVMDTVNAFRKKHI